MSEWQLYGRNLNVNYVPLEIKKKMKQNVHGSETSIKTVHILINGSIFIRTHHV